jgi:hypothetical protein
MAITKKMEKNLDFVGEIFKQYLFEKFLNPTDMNMFQKESVEWLDDYGFEWKVELVKTGIPEYRIWCSNWKSILKQKMTKTEKRKKTIYRHCTVYLKKDYDGYQRGDIFHAEYVFTHIYS